MEPREVLGLPGADLSQRPQILLSTRGLGTAFPRPIIVLNIYLMKSVNGGVFL